MTALPVALSVRPRQFLRSLRHHLQRLFRTTGAGPVEPPDSLIHPPSPRAQRHMRNARNSWW